MRKILTNLKNGNLFLYFIWTFFTKIRGMVELRRHSDLEAINRLYKIKSGRLPNIDNPILFSEKMQWIKLNYQDDLMSICADKFKVREWIEKKGYSDILCELLAVYTSANDINLDKLPDKFILKASHGSGWNLIVNEKNKVNWILWRQIIKIWLSGNIFWAGREWVYKNIKPRIVCESFLEDGSGALMDYKFHCFNGKSKFVQVNLGRGDKNHVQNFYDLDWNMQEFGKELSPSPNIKISPPNQLKRMIRIAEDLSSDFLYARVDFYEVNNKIIFGEITFFPAGGYPDFKPENYDKVWGELLEIPKRLGCE